ncbi:MAG: M48 family metallopeptidase [Syntrophorhabdaceae bacterium]|nr:M48 family metallopeptidase [Syntrophorhabdaceae bacterium]
MRHFDAHFFDGKTSLARPVTVNFDGVTLVPGNEMESGGMRVPIRDCSIDPALGRTKRSIRLPGGALLQTHDHEAVRILERSLGTNRSWNLVHFLESHWKTVVFCMACLVVVLFALVYYAIPRVSSRVALAIPPEVTASASRNTLKMFDARLLKPTGLTASRQAEISGIFRNVAHRVDPDGAAGYSLEFRTGRKIGANAFALPSGVVIVTDELISLSESDDELASIFAHEVAHVKGRHAMRSILQSTGIVFLISLLTGDITSITSFAAFLPTLLIENGYSREFEREADRAAGSFLLAGGKGTAPFRKMLEKLDASQPSALKLGVFSTHPETEGRVKYLRTLEEASGSGPK